MRQPKNAFFKTMLYATIALAVLAVVKTSADRAHAQEAATGSSASAERDAAWNSPDMLRARAWVADHVKTGQENQTMSEVEAAQHMQAMMDMTPQQMKLFAAMHAHTTKSNPTTQAHQAHAHAAQSAQQAAAAQQWWMNNVHKAEMQRAMQANNATQQAYNNINEEESAAANQEQAHLRAEQQAATENQQSKMDDLNSPYLDQMNYPYLWGGGYGGTHYHFHLYPNP